ncbi:MULTISPECIES: MFS transporter [Gordonibacter]|uniref:MFS transporter n=1 Tax=Gordonibacter faecis TaxID=3047475 RepID=A0ABT7DMW0_9ACTN|nr:MULTISPECIES: MFS transporter [unclassified Gordonibacter]MDJ1649893.1 MFS transporter [Gordonibacter sp. KGMB12511]
MDKAKTKRYATNTVIAMCIAVVFSAGIAWNTFPLFADPIISEFGCTRTEFTFGITLVNVVNAIISMFFYGRMVEKLGMRKYLLLCNTVALLAFVSFACAQNVYFIWLGGALFGFSSAGMSINTVNVIVDRWFMKNQAKYISIPNTFSAVAGIAFASLWALLIANLGWRIPFWIIVACGVVSWVLISLFYKGDPKDLGVAPMYANEVKTDGENGDDFMDDEGGVSYRGIFKTYQFWLMALGYFGNGLLAFAIMSNLALFAGDFGFGNQSGFILSVALVAQAVSFALVGPIIDKFGSRWGVAVSSLVIAVAAVIFLMGGNTGGLSPVLMYAAAVCVGFTSGAAQMPMGVSIREAFGRKEFSKKMGTVTSFCLFGFAFGPTILNAFYDIAGTYQTGLMAMIATAVATIVLLFIATRRVEVAD